jgi:hypothetical protein
MADLHERTSYPTEQLAHDLSCLYYAGAITATRSKAAATGTLRAAGTRSTYRADLTSPGTLEHLEDPPHEGSTIRESGKRV